MNLVESNKCSFCQNETETIAHLFWFCPKTQQFIKDTTTYIKHHYGKTINVNKTNWFFLTDLSCIDILVITLAKYVIHLARRNNNTPTTPALMSALKAEATKEYNGERGAINTFEKKWEQLVKIIQDLST